MKNMILCPAMVCAGFFILTITGCWWNDDSETSQRVVVKVEDKKLTAEGFAADLAFRLKSLDALAVKDPKIIDRAKKEIVKEFIVNAITKRYADEKDLLVTDEELDKYINEIRGYYPDDLAFRRALADEGMKFEEWQAKVRTSLRQRKIVEHLKEDIGEPSSKELRSYYSKHQSDFQRNRQVRLRQIVVDSENNAKRIRRELRRGKSFQALAKEFSTTYEAEKGGDIGWVEKGILDIFDRAFRMRKGQRSPILKSPYGYHIYEVIDKRRAKKSSFNEAKSKVRRILLEKREQALYASWLEKQIRRTRVFKDEKLIEGIKVETRGRE